MANAQTSLGKIGDGIECSICTSRFREPKWLNCSHTFCLQCLEQISKSQGPHSNTLPCPLCRQETVLTNGNVSNLPDNSEMKAFVQQFTQQETTMKQGFEYLEVTSKARRSMQTNFDIFMNNLYKSRNILEEVFCATKEKISQKAAKDVVRIGYEAQKLKKEAENIHKKKVEYLKSLEFSVRKEASQMTEYKLNLNAGVSNGETICDVEKASKKYQQYVPDKFLLMDFIENDGRSPHLGQLYNHDDLSVPSLWYAQRASQPQEVPGRRYLKKLKGIQIASQPSSTAGDKACKPDEDMLDDVEEAKIFIQQRQVNQQPQFTQQNPQGQIYSQPSTPPYCSNSQPVNLQPGGAVFSQGNQQGMVFTPPMRPEEHVLATLLQAPPPISAPGRIRMGDIYTNQDVSADVFLREASMAAGSSSPHSGQYAFPTMARRSSFFDQ